MIQIKSFTFNPFAENTYLLYEESGEAIIIDAGCYQAAEVAILKDFVAQAGLRPVALVNTHCHIDHVLGINALKALYQIPLLAHEAETFNFSEPALQLIKMWGFHDFEACSIDQFISEKDTLRFGNSSLEIRFTPGHSPGHLVFYHAGQGFCINGDVLFQGSIGRTDLPGGNHSQLIQSIRTQMFSLPDDTVVYTGHGSPTSIGFEKAHNPFL
jgi:glyoxylase-like metal-dependent hydrolase (beta-lactamase superfamily II)